MWSRTRNRNEVESSYKGKYYFNNHDNREKTKPWFRKLNIKRGDCYNEINRL